MFLNFEDKINNMVSANAKQLDMLDQLDKLNGQMGKQNLYRIVSSTKKSFAESSNNIAKLEIPGVLPKNIKESLKIIKGDFSFGFKALEESMNNYAKIPRSQNPVLYWKSIKQRDIGVTYINGELTSLTVARCS